MFYSKRFHIRSHLELGLGKFYMWHGDDRSQSSTRLCLFAGSTCLFVLGFLGGGRFFSEFILLLVFRLCDMQRRRIQ